MLIGRSRRVQCGLSSCRRCFRARHLLPGITCKLITGCAAFDAIFAGCPGSVARSVTSRRPKVLALPVSTCSAVRQRLSGEPAFPSRCLFGVSTRIVARTRSLPPGSFRTGCVCKGFFRLKGFAALIILFRLIFWRGEYPVKQRPQHID